MGRALQHAGGGEHEPPDLTALAHGAASLLGHSSCPPKYAAEDFIYFCLFWLSGPERFLFRIVSCSAAGVTLTTWLQALQHLCGSAAL